MYIRWMNFHQSHSKLMKIGLMSRDFTVLFIGKLNQHSLDSFKKKHWKFCRVGSRFIRNNTKKIPAPFLFYMIVSLNKIDIATRSRGKILKKSLKLFKVSLIRVFVKKLCRKCFEWLFKWVHQQKAWNDERKSGKWNCMKNTFFCIHF